MIRGRQPYATGILEQRSGGFVKFQHSRRYVLWASILIFLSGLSGTLYLNFAAQPAYGLLAFLQGPQSLLPWDPAFAILVESTLLISFAFASAGFFLFGKINNHREPNQRFARGVRVLITFLVISYLEAISVSVASIAIGIQNTENFHPLAFGTGNIVENLLIVLAVIFLVTFTVFAGAGSFFGITGSTVNAIAQSDRWEFALMGAFLFGGILYAPLSIAAGLIGIFTAMTEKSYLKDYSISVFWTLLNAAGQFLSSRKLQFLALGVSSFFLVLMFYISTFTVAVYSDGSPIFYTSKYVHGDIYLLLALGIVASTTLLVTSILSIFRARVKYVVIACSAALIFIVGIYMYFMLAFQNTSHFLLHSKIQAEFWAFPFVVAGFIFGEILPLLYESSRKGIERSAAFTR